MHDANQVYNVKIGGVGASTLIEVWLTQNSGADGNDGTLGGSVVYPTWTYDVYTDAAKTHMIGTAVAVVFARYLQTSVTPHGTRHCLLRWLDPASAFGG